jgi:hypothetical protein
MSLQKINWDPGSSRFQQEEMAEVLPRSTLVFSKGCIIADNLLYQFASTKTHNIFSSFVSSKILSDAEGKSRDFDRGLMRSGQVTQDVTILAPSVPSSELPQ